MSFSRGGKSQSTTSTTTTNLSQPTQLQDIEGTGVANVGGNVTVISSDMNAFDDASSLARSAVDYAEASNLALLRTIGDTNARSLDFGEKVIGEQAQTQADSLRFAETVQEGQQTFVSDVLGSLQNFFDRALGFAEQTEARSQETLGGTVAALQGISKEQNTSADQRVADIASSSIKYGLIALAVVAAFFVFKGSKS